MKLLRDGRARPGHPARTQARPYRRRSCACWPGVSLKTSNYSPPARGEQMLAGVLVYESKSVAHAQYISSTDEGRETGAPDLLLDYLISEQYSAKRYFDFGISTEQSGRHLNKGLMTTKKVSVRGLCFTTFTK